MVLRINCVEPIYPQYSGVLETGLALRYWIFEVLGSKSVKEGGKVANRDLVTTKHTVCCNTLML